MVVANEVPFCGNGPEDAQEEQFLSKTAFQARAAWVAHNLTIGVAQRVSFVGASSSISLTVFKRPKKPKGKITQSI